MPVAAQGSATGRIVAAASPRWRFRTQPAQQAPVLFRVRGAGRRSPPYRAASPGCARNHPRRGGARYTRSDPACRSGSAWLVTAIALNVAGARTGDSNGRPPVRPARTGVSSFRASRKTQSYPRHTATCRSRSSAQARDRRKRVRICAGWTRRLENRRSDGFSRFPSGMKAFSPPRNGSPRGSCARGAGPRRGRSWRRRRRRPDSAARRPHSRC